MEDPLTINRSFINFEKNSISEWVIRKSKSKSVQINSFIQLKNLKN